jgi:hypothetical protein
MFGRPAVRDQVLEWVDKAIGVQDGAVLGHVDAVRARTPDATPAQVVAALENQYLATTSGAGAAVGGVASVPGIGTTFAVGLSVAETAAFLDATAVFAFATAEALGHRIGDMPRRRAIFLSALLGDEAVALAGRAADGTRDGWAARVAALDDESVDEINRTAEKWLLTRFGPRQGLLVVGRLVPFGIGAAVGAAGNAVTAKGVIVRIRSAFAGGPVPVPLELAQSPATPSEASPSEASAPVAGVRPARTPADLPEPPTGKYLPLFALLTARTGADVELTLSEADEALANAGGLPGAARRSEAWWSNDPAPRAPQARAWLAAGLHVDTVDLKADLVRLTRPQVSRDQASQP